MVSAYKAFTFNDITATGKVLGDLTVDYCKDISGAAVSQVGMTLTELGVGDYILMNPNITLRTICRLKLTSDTTKRVVVEFNPVDGNLTTVEGTINANITHVIGDAVQANSTKETNWGGT